jgi:hypothetical protein
MTKRLPENMVFKTREKSKRPRFGEAGEINNKFITQVNAFIEKYRSALKRLARK